MNTKTVTAKEDSYFDRNSPWLEPAGATLLIFTLPLVFTALEVPWPFSTWSIFVGAAVGSCLTGIGSMQVDTVSSKIVRAVSVASIIGALLLLFWNYY